VLFVKDGHRVNEFGLYKENFTVLQNSLQALNAKGFQMKEEIKRYSGKLKVIQKEIIELHDEWFKKLISTKGIDFKELKEFKNDLFEFMNSRNWAMWMLESPSSKLNSYEREYQTLSKKRKALMAEIKRWLKTIDYPNYELDGSKAATSTKKELKEIKGKITIMKNDHADALKIIRELEKTPLDAKIQLLEQIIALSEDFNVQAKDGEILEELDTKFDEFIATLDSINDIERWKEWLLGKIQDRNNSGICNMKFSDSDIECFITVGAGPILKELEFISTRMIVKKEALLNRENKFSKLDLTLLNTTKHDFSKNFRNAFTLSKIRNEYDDMILQTNELKDKIEKKLVEMNTRLNQDIAASTKRHFKHERFNMLIVSSIDKSDKDFIKEKKNDWPRYPNYHIITENISNSTKKHEVVDSLVKLPIRAELAIECFENGLSPEHAKILEHMDEDGELIGIHKKGVAVELILSLKDEIDNKWYDALLQDPEFHEQIAEIKSKRFHVGLWEKLKSGIIEVWQYHVIAGTEFDEEELNDMCEAEDVWGEAEGFYAPNHNLESRFKTLKSVHEPTKSEGDGKRSIISTDDIFDALREVTECSKVSKREIRSTKVKQSKKDPFNIF
jgi:hypothetical protein